MPNSQFPTSNGSQSQSAVVLGVGSWELGVGSWELGIGKLTLMF